MTRIELRDLSFGYDGGMVFSDVSAVFDRPELVPLIDVAILKASEDSVVVVSPYPGIEVSL